jgi:membrane protease YdiL (CAAX protease family)
METSARRPWQKHPATLLAAVCAGVLPVYALVFISDYTSMTTTGFQLPDMSGMLINLLVMVVGFGGWLTFLLYIVCGERLESLLLRPGQLTTDLNQGLVIACGLLGIQICLSVIADLVFSVEVPASTILIAETLASDPALLALWLGPVVWLQAGFFEEYTRIFMLSRLWQVWPGNTARWLVLCGSALLFGLGHFYQGPYGILGTASIGFILGWHYLRFGRVLPLIIAHALYDTVVLLFLVSAARQGFF